MVCSLGEKETGLDTDAGDDERNRDRVWKRVQKCVGGSGGLEGKKGKK